jgi:threonine dehydratase
MLTSAFRSAAISSSRRVAVLRNGAPSSTLVRFFSENLEGDNAEEPPVSESDVNKLPTPAGKLPIEFADISRAEVAIRGGVRRTNCEKSHFISELVGANVYFKNEFCQFTGSFKERGARNAIIQLKREKGSSLRGVIAASAGNHALALAYHGKDLGVPVTVVMPTVAPLAKVDKCRVSRDGKQCRR